MYYDTPAWHQELLSRYNDEVTIPILLRGVTSFVVLLGANTMASTTCCCCDRLPTATICPMIHSYSRR